MLGEPPANVQVDRAALNVDKHTIEKMRPMKEAL